MAALAAAFPWRPDAVFNWRNRLLASPRFQRCAAGFPFTRGIAKREARALFDLCAGFVYAQVLRACVELDLFEQLARGPVSVDVLASRARMPEPQMHLLLRAAASLRLLEPAGSAEYRLGRLGAALRGNPGIAAMVCHHSLFYDDLADPVALLRGREDNKLAKFWPYQGHPGDAAAYSKLMAVSQPFITREILDRYNFAGHRAVLDLGGGDGSFLRALAAAAPELRRAMFDLPEVAAQARARLGEAGVAADVFGGSFFEGDLPAGADLITAIRILHDHGDAAAMLLLRAAHQALPPGGTLLIAEPLAGGSDAGPMADAYFSLYLLAAGAGRPRRAGEIFHMLRAAGFSKIREIATRQPILTGLIVAQKLV
jgi:demethylspheroidene O-methyltransferase